MRRIMLALATLLTLLATASAASALPVNTELPKVTGEAKQGATLETSNGKWSPEGSAFGYSWERCNTSGAECAYEEGFNAKTYAAREADIGHTIRSTVADICGGLCFVFAKSAPTATVTRTTGCLGHEAECGLPSKTSVGVEPGQELTASGGITAKTEGQEIHNVRITGEAEGPYIDIEASGVKIKNVEIDVANERHKICEEHVNATGLGIIRVGDNFGAVKSGIVIEHVTVTSPGESCPLLGGDDVQNSNASRAASQIVVKASSFSNSSMCWNGSMTVEGSYCGVNGAFTGDHYDGLFLGANDAVLKGDTIIVPHKQTSPVAVFNQNGPITGLTVEGSLLAGGGWLAYGGEKCAGKTACEGGVTGEAVTGPVVFKKNRLARCTGTSIAAEGGHYCEGHPAVPDSENQEQALGGYWPQGGFFGTWEEMSAAHTSGEGNVWDNNNEAAPTP